MFQGKGTTFGCMTDKSLMIKKKITISENMISVVELLADGYNVTEISETKNINKRTLEARLDRLRRDTGCKNITHLACFFIREKIIG